PGSPATGPTTHSCRVAHRSNHRSRLTPGPTDPRRGEPGWTVSLVPGIPHRYAQERRWSSSCLRSLVDSRAHHRSKTRGGMLGPVTQGKTILLSHPVTSAGAATWARLLPGDGGPRRAMVADRAGRSVPGRCRCCHRLVDGGVRADVDAPAGQPG